jgi:hypothetical protein
LVSILQKSVSFVSITQKNHFIRKYSAKKHVFFSFARAEMQSKGLFTRKGLSNVRSKSARTTKNKSSSNQTVATGVLSEVE